MTARSVDDNIDPVSAELPPVAEKTKTTLVVGSSKPTPTQDVGQHTLHGKAEGAQREKGAKSEKELERERKKAEKQAKFDQKKAKAKTPVLTLSATKEKKANAESKAEKKALPPYVEETSAGSKKIIKSFDDPYYKAYNPLAVESAWYAWWEKEGFFKPDFTADGKVKDEGSFVIVEPPPNVTGNLHMGHALGNALQDVMIRYNRMCGKTTLWLPGCDHASISTQSVVENMLWRRQKKTRHDLGRAKFTEVVWDWKTEYHQNINRLSGRTLIDVPGYDKKVEFGIIVHFRYEIQGTDETIEVATTRPETMLGDTGIAVHPDDKRYQHLIGKIAIHPFIPGRLMPIVADDYVEKDFGTGAVKITPAHDANDFALGSRHNLEFINILTDDGRLNENAGPYAGQKRFDVRYTIQDDLKKAGLYVDKKDNPMTVPLCEKSKDVIEPLLKPQWWMKMKDMAADALNAVKTGEIKILPETAEKSYIRWMENVNDWCLSRQLWWGHQAPVYFAQIDGEEHDEAGDHLWFSGRTQEEAEIKAKKALPGKSFTLKRDEDVLDTWFSAGLWPFATLGWPKNTHDFETLFPTSILETGWDILFFWIARMIMFSIKLTGKVPFTEVFCHSLIRDSEGRKMSKSLGNVIDPQDVIEGIALEDLHKKLLLGNLNPLEVEKATKYQKTAFPDGIPECGTDALRFALVSYTGASDVAFDIKVIHSYRKFCNKIFQATKYVLGNIGDDFVPRSSGKLTGKESLAERWILRKLTIAARDLNQAITDREFMKSTAIIYQYWYNHLCDVYIENSKAILQDGTPEEKRSARDTLYTALESGLTLIHPFMPFLTEELWQRLSRRPDDKTPSIMLARYPSYDANMDDPAAEVAYELVLDISRGIRSLLSEYSLKGEGKVFVQTYTPTAQETVTAQIQSIRSLSGKGIASMSILTATDSRPSGCVAFSISTDAAVFVHVKGRVDIDHEITKATIKLDKTKLAIEKQLKILNDESYKEKVSKEVQQAEESRLKDLEIQRKALEETITQFEALTDKL
ncbi:tRNA synthetases class I-domain-containing protein [Calycina marina]|uniref:Valine--tRNA ligase, mitochondrial n=1 Tax=Calycina marina TaxID=1763456 RepID=A0A9P7Z2J6_9HELO|nr:tRNA synthetases class I-domain-containing protein [Calycina marina]